MKQVKLRSMLLAALVAVLAVSDLCGFLRKASEFCINFCFNINGHFINNNAYGFFVIFMHLTKEDLIGSYQWKGNLDLLNIIMLGLAKNLPEHDETYELHRQLFLLWKKVPPVPLLWKAGTKLLIFQEEGRLFLFQGKEKRMFLL